MAKYLAVNAAYRAPGPDAPAKSKGQGRKWWLP
jgi:hypothetical protein